MHRKDVSQAYNLMFGIRRMPVFQPTSRDLPPVLLVSPGGSAATMLIEHVSRFVRTNDAHDEDGLKHLPTPPPGAGKIVFVYDDPEVIARSLERRNYLMANGAKLGQPLCAVTTGRLQRRLFVGAARRQIRAFDRPGIFPVRYSDLWSSVPALAEYLSIDDPAFVTSFPPRRGRATPAIGLQLNTEYLLRGYPSAEALFEMDRSDLAETNSDRARASAATGSGASSSA